jgi:hypothetical protein
MTDAVQIRRTSGPISMKRPAKGKLPWRRLVRLLSGLRRLDS